MTLWTLLQLDFERSLKQEAIQTTYGYQSNAFGNDQIGVFIIITIMLEAGKLDGECCKLARKPHILPEVW